MLAVVTVAALGLAGCTATGSTTPSSNSATGKTLNLGLLIPPTTFEAANASWGPETPFMQAVYDTLLIANPKGDIEPNLATKWSYNADKTVLTLTLRSGVKFSDGSALTASAVVQNLIRFRDGVSANKSLLASIESATAVGDHTVKITLTAVDPALLVALTQNAGLMESPKAFGASDVKTSPDGSGPYTLDTAKTVVGSTYVFEKKKNYWNPSMAHYGSIVMTVYPNPTAALNALKGGQVNALPTTQLTAYLPQVQAAGFTLNKFSLNWDGLLLFDRGGTMNPALGKLKVRQAINYAIDKQGMLKAVGLGNGTVTGQIFPTSSPAFDKTLDSYYSYNPTKAKQLMAEAGYANGFTLNMPSTTAFGPAAFPLIVQQLKAIGVTVNLTNDGTNYINDMVAAKYAAAAMALQQDPTAWQLINFQIAKSSTWNPFHYDDPTVDGYINTVQHGSTAQSDAAVKALNKYIVQQAWFDPWFRPEIAFATDAKTQATPQAGNTVPYLWNISPKS